jgi:cytochrome b561
VKFRNRHGTPVDPVPFLVVSVLAFLVSFSYGPGYCMALGLSLSWGLAVSALSFCFVTGLSYHRLVWTARPERRGEIPTDQRLRRLLYAVVAVALLLALLAIPLLVSWPQ